MKLIDIKGIGPKIYQILLSKGINNIESLLYTIPSSYEIYKLSSFSYFEPFNAKAVIIDEIKSKKVKNLTLVTFEALIDELRFNCVAFNMAYIEKAFKVGDEVVLVGSYQEEYKRVLVNKIVPLKDYKEGIIPLYNIDGISNAHFQKIVIEALKYYIEKYSVIPSSFFSKYNYKTGKELLESIHNPKEVSDYKSAKNALKYYELLSFSIKLKLIRDNILSERKTPKEYDIVKVRSFINEASPFTLTEDQKKAVNDIFKYLKSDHVLNMLLEGDVGSGKTIVALISIYAVYTSNMQSLVMVPTESLAIQHYNTFKKYLDNYGVKVELLTSSTKTKERKRILEELSNGTTNVIIGTHSLISDEVVFKNLGFVVCDEQHKFGVEQRKKIKEKGINPDVLYMTATPIPRTLALTFYNDMTLEAIKVRPETRKKSYTFLHTYKDYLKVLDFVKSEIDEGRQAYFVASVIEENKDSYQTSVLRIKNDLEKYYNNIRIGLLHGKLSEEEKLSVLDSFMKKEIDILASTTVIEVGIDNPNASVMVIIDADRFGLSTLHQLRGRVGRGNYSGYTFLMVENKTFMDRLKILEETDDGFLISEADLKDRGPGDFLGKDQSGAMKFSFANIVTDKELFYNAREDAAILLNDPKIKEYYSSKLYSDSFD